VNPFRSINQFPMLDEQFEDQRLSYINPPISAAPSLCAR
jgi:hypothetical protein